MSIPTQDTTTHIGEPVHITITRNAKGQTQIEVSIHGKTVEETASDAERLYDRLNARYPFDGGQ